MSSNYSDDLLPDPLFTFLMKKLIKQLSKFKYLKCFFKLSCIEILVNFHLYSFFWGIFLPLGKGSGCHMGEWWCLFPCKLQWKLISGHCTWVNYNNSRFKYCLRCEQTAKPYAVWPKCPSHTMEGHEHHGSVRVLGCDMCVTASQARSKVWEGWLGFCSCDSCTAAIVYSL
jgi:hypothetical protein